MVDEQHIWPTDVGIGASQRMGPRRSGLQRHEASGGKRARIAANSGLIPAAALWSFNPSGPEHAKEGRQEQQSLQTTGNDRDADAAWEGSLPCAKGDAVALGLGSTRSSQPPFAQSTTRTANPTAPNHLPKPQTAKYFPNFALVNTQELGNMAQRTGIDNGMTVALWGTRAVHPGRRGTGRLRARSLLLCFCFSSVWGFRFCFSGFGPGVGVKVRDSVATWALQRLGMLNLASSGMMHASAPDCE